MEALDSYMVLCVTIKLEKGYEIKEWILWQVQ